MLRVPNLHNTWRLEKCSEATLTDLHHVLGLLGALTDGLGDVDEQRLIGARQQLYQRRDAATLADGQSVLFLLCQLSQRADYVH